MDLKLIFMFAKEVSLITVSLITSLFMPRSFFWNTFLNGFNILFAMWRQTDTPPTKICDSKVAIFLVETGMFIGSEFMAYKRYAESKLEDSAPPPIAEGALTGAAIVIPPMIKSFICLYNLRKQANNQALLNEATIPNTASQVRFDIEATHLEVLRPQAQEDVHESIGCIVRQLP